MSATKLSGRNVRAVVGNYRTVFESTTMNIEDGSKAVMTNGRPNGSVSGEVKASGQFVLDWENFTILLGAARQAGSFEQAPLVDIVFTANTGTERMKIEGFGCLIKVSDLLNAESNGDTKSMVTLPYEVCGQEFVKINGVPYLDPRKIQELRSSPI